MSDDMFKVHKLNHRGMARADRLGRMFETHLSLLREICSAPENNIDTSYDFLKCMEHLQLASFYAKRSIAVRAENQEQERKPFGSIGDALVGKIAETAQVAPQPTVRFAGIPIDQMTGKDLTELYFEAGRELSRREVNRAER